MARITTNWTGGIPGPAHPAAPEPIEAVAGAPAVNGGNLLDNSQVGAPAPRPVVIVIDGRNLVDIITELQTLLP